MSIYMEIAELDREIIKHLENVKTLRAQIKALHIKRIFDESGYNAGNKLVHKEDSKMVMYIFGAEFTGDCDLLLVRTVMEKTERFGYSHKYTVEFIKHNFKTVETDLKDYAYVQCAQTGALKANINNIKQ